MLNQRLSQKLLQKLSPQQIQLMKLLQIPTDQLEQRIKEELEANPALEEAGDYEAPEDDIFSNDDNAADQDDNSEMSEELDLSEYLDDDYPDYKTQGDSYNPDDDEDNRTIPVAVAESFHENLLRQLGMVHLDDKRRAIAKQIIGSIDDDGYLRREIPAIIDDLAFSQNIMAEEEDVIELLDVVQGFDPPGVGARDLKECLLLQLERKLHTKTVNLAITVVEEYFDEFTKKHYEKLGKQLKLEDDKLKIVIDEI